MKFIFPILLISGLSSSVYPRDLEFIELNDEDQLGLDMKLINDEPNSGCTVTCVVKFNFCIKHSKNNIQMFACKIAYNNCLDSCEG